jgi:quercetin dioxygenase-like cupin family protein
MKSLPNLVDLHNLVRADEPWIEQSPMTAVRVLWVGSESGAWVSMHRWKAGFIARRHMHLAPAHVFCLSGRMRHNDTDAVMGPGDYSFEPAGAIHGATTALEDNVHLIFQLGAVLHLNDDGTPCGYHGWQAMEALRSRQEK